MGRYQFFGYRRGKNGRVGIRNHVVILPLDDLSNAAAEAVANNIKGTLALPHAYGRLQFGEDLEQHIRTLIGTGSNPNVAACVVIGIEPSWTGRVVDGIAKTGKPVAGFAIEGNGDISTIANASRKAREFVQWASEKQRETCSINELFVSTKCGESDTTSGLASCPTVGNLADNARSAWRNNLFRRDFRTYRRRSRLRRSRAATKEIGDKFMQVFRAYQEVIERHKTSDLSESQPHKKAILPAASPPSKKRPSAISRKSARRRQPVADVLKPAEAPAKGPGLYYMDTSSAAAECVTLQAAAGFVVHLFPTGQGNVIGNPIEPVIKLTANPKTARTMSEHINLDVSGISAPRNDHGSGGRSVDRNLKAHLQRPPHLRRSPRPPRIRNDQAFPNQSAVIKVERKQEGTTVSWPPTGNPLTILREEVFCFPTQSAY